MRPTSAKPMAIRRCFAPNRSAIPSPRRLRFTNHVQPGIVEGSLHCLVVSRATTTRPLDATEELFDELSSVAAAAAVDDESGERPAVAFTCSTSTASTSSPSSPSSSPRSSSPPSKGRGLFATRDLRRGEVALRVPGSLCLVVDYSLGGGGLSLPTGDDEDGRQPKGFDSSGSSSWPRTRAAVAKDPEAPWDFLLALALLDAVSGDGGGSWWQRFADGVLPQPSLGGGLEGDDDDDDDDEEGGGGEGEGDGGGAVPPSFVTLPLCLPAALLALAGHRGLALAAAEQQRRLRDLYPALAAPASAGADYPTMMQWALACVRSRAFALGGGGGGGGAAAARGSGSGGGKNGSERDAEEPEEELAFAFVPLLDCANHAEEPNAAFRPVWTFGDGAGGGGTDEKKSRKLDSVELVAVKDIESGREVSVSYTGPRGATNRRLMAQYGFVPVGGNAADRVEFDFERASAESGLPLDAKLDLDRLQDLLGPQVSSDIMRGKNLYLFAAIKSLPLASRSSSPSSPPSSSSSHNIQLARALLSQVEEQLLEVVEASTSSSSDKKKGGADAAAPLAADAERRYPGSALAAVLRYRAERGSLLRAARAALRLYCAGAEEE